MWGLIRKIEVGKDCTCLDINNLDILKDGVYFMVFIPNNITSGDVRYWGLINGDQHLVNYCTSYIEKIGGVRQPGYCEDEPCLGLAAGNSSGLIIFTLLLDGTNYVRWKTWETSGIHKDLVESSRGTYYRKKVVNVTEFSICSDVKNAIGAGSKLLIYGKYKAEKPKPSIKEFTLTGDHQFLINEEIHNKILLR